MTRHRRISPCSRTGSTCAGLALSFIVLAISFALAAATVAAAPRQAPGSRVSLELPDNFQTSKVFMGYIEFISSIAAVIQERPAAEHARIKGRLTAPILAKNGITDVVEGKLARDDDYLFITAKQSHARGRFDKFMLLIRDERSSALITFNVPKGAFAEGAVSREDVIRALTSARLETAAAPFNDPFKFTYLGRFATSPRISGSTRLFTEAGDDAPMGTRNLLIVVPSLNRYPVDDIAALSKASLEGLRDIRDVKIVSDREVQIDAMNGRKTTATALRGSETLPIMLRQLILLPPEGGYFRVLAITRAADEARLAPEIARIFAGFARVKAK